MLHGPSSGRRSNAQDKPFTPQCPKIEGSRRVSWHSHMNVRIDIHTSCSPMDTNRSYHRARLLFPLLLRGVAADLVALPIPRRLHLEQPRNRMHGVPPPRPAAAAEDGIGARVDRARGRGGGSELHAGVRVRVRAALARRAGGVPRRALETDEDDDERRVYTLRGKTGERYGAVRAVWCGAGGSVQ